LAIDYPKVVALIVREQSWTIIPQRGLHVLLEHCFGLEKMTVTVDDHDCCLSRNYSAATHPRLRTGR
jgi:hypothetical protein